MVNNKLDFLQQIVDSKLDFLQWTVNWIFYDEYQIGFLYDEQLIGFFIVDSKLDFLQWTVNLVFYNKQ